MPNNCHEITTIKSCSNEWLFLFNFVETGERSPETGNRMSMGKECGKDLTVKARRC
jgi:hypothetical protein